MYSIWKYAFFKNDDGVKKKKKETTILQTYTHIVIKPIFSTQFCKKVL